jgi:hypothetical protein
LKCLSLRELSRWPRIRARDAWTEKNKGLPCHAIPTLFRKLPARAPPIVRGSMMRIRSQSTSGRSAWGCLWCGHEEADVDGWHA